jgi:conjugal transfer pilus assembly protein TraV
MTPALATRSAHVALIISFTVVALCGCTSMSGLGGSSDYGCKAPEGVTCDSVSGTYANAIHHNLPSQRARRPMPAISAEAEPRPPMPAAARLVTSSSPAAPQALRSQARVLRLWFKPWEDADRDLYDQGYVYVQIDSGQWLIDHVQRQIRDAYAPLRPPPKSAASSSPAEAKDRASIPLGIPLGSVRPEIPQRPAPAGATDRDTLLPPPGVASDDTP